MWSLGQNSSRHHTANSPKRADSAEGFRIACGDRDILKKGPLEIGNDGSRRNQFGVQRSAAWSSPDVVPSLNNLQLPGGRRQELDAR